MAEIVQDSCELAVEDSSEALLQRRIVQLEGDIESVWIEMQSVVQKMLNAVKVQSRPVTKEMVLEWVEKVQESFNCC